jgi:hypothetical protein
MKRGIYLHYVPGQATWAGFHDLPPQPRERFAA